MIGQDARLNAESRGAERYSTNFIGALIVDRRPTPVRVVNISRIGTMIKGVSVPVGTEVVLDCPSFQVVATVVWTSDQACGLNFHHPVDVVPILKDAETRGEPDEDDPLIP